LRTNNLLFIHTIGAQNQVETNQQRDMQVILQGPVVHLNS